MRVVIRADGDRRIGVGHVMRTLALAQELRTRGEDVTLAAVRLDEELRVRAASMHVDVELCDLDAGGDDDLAWLTGLARAQNAAWVVVDGYRFDHRAQETLGAAGLHVVFVDDYGDCERYDADIVLNQNVSATAAQYTRLGPRTRLLLGPAHALLRREFVDAAAAGGREAVSQAASVLVTLGGADPEQAVTRVLDVLGVVRDKNLRIRLVAGPSNPRYGEIKARVADERVEVVEAVRDMVPFMLEADLAITGAGSTVYELGCLGVPTVVVAIARAQVEIARALDREGLAVSLGWHASIDVPGAAQVIAGLAADARRRQALSNRGRELVDGRGAARVVDAMAAASRPS